MPAPTLDATVAGSAANSYADLATAAALLAVRPGGEPAWDAATDPPRALALMQATAILEREAWVGRPATALQRLQWPRVGVDAYGVALDASAIPLGIQQATAELAERILAAGAATDPTALTGLAQYAGLLKSVKAGPVTLDLNAAAAASAETPGSTLPLVVRQVVARYLRTLTPAPLTGSLPVVRAA